MTIVAKRLLWVRDDGAGQERAIPVSLDDFHDEAAIVLLANPGMGKTTLFREYAGQQLPTVRTFLTAPTTTGTILFLDGLDEYRSLGNQDAALALATALRSVGRPKFRVSCRAADWWGSSDLEVLRMASASGRVVILELLPLSEKEILTVLEGQVSDPLSFLIETRAAGIGDLLSNPQTLELVIKAWQGGKKPQNKYEAYQLGVNELLKEMNSTHQKSAPSNIQIPPLRAATAATSSAILLSNTAGVSRTDSATTDSYFHYSTVPHPVPVEVQKALERRTYARDSASGGLGIYLVFWSGEAEKRKLPPLPSGVGKRPTSPTEIEDAIKSLMSDEQRGRLKVIALDISPVE